MPGACVGNNAAPIAVLDEPVRTLDRSKMRVGPNNGIKQQQREPLGNADVAKLSNICER